MSVHPEQQQPTAVVIMDRNQYKAAPQNIRDFSSGLCGCFEDCGSCLCAWCFPCGFVCSLSSRMNESCCVPVCLPGGLMAMRTKLRTMFGISGSICYDCLCLSCCWLCAVTQMHREMKACGMG